MILWLRIYKDKILKGVLIILLVSWALVSSFKLLMSKDQVMIVYMTPKGAKLLTEMSDTHLDFEKENFIHYFVGHFYHFNSINYETKMDLSLKLLSEKAALSFVENLNSMFEKTKIHHIEQFSRVQKIEKITEDEFEIEVYVKRISGIDEIEDTYKIQLKIRDTNRTLENPYGYEVYNIKEEHV